MTSSKYILLVASLLQLSKCIFSELSTTEEAQIALQKLDNQIVNSTILVSETVPSIWKSYVGNVNETVHRELFDDIGNFSALLNNLTEYATLVINGTDCVSGLEKYLDLDSYIVEAVTSQDQVYNNFLSLANTELDYIVDQFDGLKTDFTRYCETNTTICEGTSNFIVAEAERLTQIARRIPYDLVAETHLLRYRLEADWALNQANINTNYNKGVQTATTCLALKFEKYRGDSHGTNLETEIDTPVSSSYLDLIMVSETTFDFSIADLLSDFLDILYLAEAEYYSTSANVRRTIFKVNQTISSLNNFAQDLNITVDCTNPDVLPLLNSSLSTGLRDYTRYLDALSARYKEGLKYLSTTVHEAVNLKFQAANCTSSPSCDSIYEKINRKIIDIPSVIQARGNATAVLQHQYGIAIRQSGYEILRDVYDRLEAQVVLLKDCVRGYLYDDDL